MANNGKKIALLGVCAGLAMSAIDAMKSSETVWDADALGAQSGKTNEAGRLESIASNVVSGPRASQSLGHAWYKLSEKVMVDGVVIGHDESMIQGGDFVKAQSGCYAACYGNCYGNCYSNCFSADS